MIKFSIDGKSVEVPLFKRNLLIKADGERLRLNPEL